MGQYDSWENLSNFIKKNWNDWEEQIANPPYSIKVKRHPTRDNLVMFKYSQFESDFSNPVVRCCRGSVYDIRKDGTVKPYLCPFYKFSNLGEKGADPINWNEKVFVRDKKDGSLIKLLVEENGDFLWTTNGSFDLDVTVLEIYNVKSEEYIPPPHTFATLRDHALKGHEKELTRLPKGWVFMFELISPYNKIIVPYAETKLVFLGCRDEQFVEHTPEEIKEQFSLTFETPEIYALKNIDEVIAYSESINTNDREGVVIQDSHFNRVKCKSAHYRTLSLLKGEDHFSDDGIFNALKEEILDDALAAWPEIRPRSEEIIKEWLDFKKNVQAIMDKAIAYYNVCKTDTLATPQQIKKQYAQFVLAQYQPFSSFCFEAIKENADFNKIFDKIDYKQLRSYWMPAVESVIL